MVRIAASAYRRLYEAANYRLRSFAGGRWAGYCRPTAVALLVTERCNARCVHCDIWKNRGQEESPGLDRWKEVLEDLRRWLGPIQVTLTGGEALLRSFTPELVAHGTSLGLFMEVLTHGYWPDQARIEQLALARPWRVTVSLDGLGETHTRIRGRRDFFEHTSTTLRTLQRIRGEQGLDFTILLKTVIMEHNLHAACEVARFAQESGLEVFYQPIEQNYNTPDDPRWFEGSANWPKDPSRAVAVVERLIELKRAGLPISNSYAQLEVMIPYFGNPEASRVATQSHTAHERRQLCAALTHLQLQANGDVTNCSGRPPIGNIKTASIRRIWESRPRAWESGCCLEWRRSEEEKDRQLLSEDARS
jgi:MoaA/NifB/PqqE/SkfB family radical SAM enzyme